MSARHLESAAALADGVAMGSHGAVRCTSHKKSFTASTNFYFLMYITGVGNCVSGHCDTEGEASGKSQ